VVGAGPEGGGGASCQPANGFHFPSTAIGCVGSFDLRESLTIFSLPCTLFFSKRIWNIFKKDLNKYNTLI